MFQCKIWSFGRSKSAKNNSILVIVLPCLCHVGGVPRRRRQASPRRRPPPPLKRSPLPFSSPILLSLPRSSLPRVARSRAARAAPPSAASATPRCSAAVPAPRASPNPDSPCPLSFPPHPEPDCAVTQPNRAPRRCGRHCPLPELRLHR